MYMTMSHDPPCQHHLLVAGPTLRMLQHRDIYRTCSTSCFDTNKRLTAFSCCSLPLCCSSAEPSKLYLAPPSPFAL